MMLAAVAAVLAFSTPALGQDKQEMRFRNNLLPGHLTRHRIKRVVTRTGQRGGDTEILKYGQIATWLQCNIDETAPGKMMVYQMMVDRPAAVIGVKRDGKRIKPNPAPTDYGLSKGSTRLHSATLTPSDGAAQVPLTDIVERVVLQTLLDYPHWPRQRIDAGHRWERTFEIPGFKGKQALEFVDLVRIEGDVTARLTMYIEGEFTGGLAAEYTFDKAQAILYWLRMDRTLLKMEAQAFYERRRPTEPDAYKLKLNVALQDKRMLNEEQCDLVKDQMTVFSLALDKHRQRFPKEARQICQEFRRRWPNSMWLPAVEELESRARSPGQGEVRLSDKALKDALVKAVLAHEAAAQNAEYDIMEASESALAGLAREYHRKLEKFARSTDDGLRSRAVFALAFGDKPDDLTIVQRAVRDESPQVRELALAGLAARRSPATSVELLLIALEDKSAKVRSRACEAIAVCIPPEHYAVVTIAERLGKLIIHDDSDAVRIAAVKSLARVGATADVSILEEALDYEADFAVREEIHRAIDTLKAKGV